MNSPACGFSLGSVVKSTSSGSSNLGRFGFRGGTGGGDGDLSVLARSLSSRIIRPRGGEGSRRFRNTRPRGGVGSRAPCAPRAWTCRRAAARRAGPGAPLPRAPW